LQAEEDEAYPGMQSGLPDPDAAAGGRLTVDLAALVRNWRRLAALAPDAETSAVVKADAYGIGLEPAVGALAAAGCRTFFVALPDEGRRARSAAPDARIFILGGFFPGAADLYRGLRLQPVLNSPAEIGEWLGLGGERPAPAIHVDTGMNRLGLTPSEAGDLAAQPEKLTALAPALLISHLACADAPGEPRNAVQLAAFRTVRRLFPFVPASLANSAGIHLGPDYHFDLTRPGIMLYGATAGGALSPLDPVVTAEARIVQVRDALPGETVGYGAAETLRRNTRIAVLAAGYADGYHRLAGASDRHGGAAVAIRGGIAPLLGRVSMDLIAADVTDIPGAARGDWAELFGPAIPVDAVATRAGTIGYELLTGLGRRYVRHYRS
jgi:alanine racemase